MRKVLKFAIPVFFALILAIGGNTFKGDCSCSSPEFALAAIGCVFGCGDAKPPAKETSAVEI